MKCRTVRKCCPAFSIVRLVAHIPNNFDLKVRENMRKIIRLGILLLVSTCVFPGRSISAKAADQAQFYVQSAEVKKNGLIRTSVYLTGTSNLGGVEAALYYDSSKVDYVSSGLGESFSDGIGETHGNEEQAVVKLVNIYAQPKEAHGELMYAIFELKEGVESYQPRLEVIEVVDGSDEILPLSYTISYQQSDGNWAEEQDDSGKAATKETITAAREKYGADIDQQDRMEEELQQGEMTAEETVGETIEKTIEENTEKKAEKSQPSLIPLRYVVGGVIVGSGFFGLLIYIIVKGIKRHEKRN